MDKVKIYFSANGGTQTVQMTDNFVKWKEYTLLKFQYTLNYKNIQASFANNKLYLGPLITDPIITIPDGLYDVLDLN